LLRESRLDVYAEQARNGREVPGQGAELVQASYSSLIAFFGWFCGSEFAAPFGTVRTDADMLGQEHAAERRKIVSIE